MMAVGTLKELFFLGVLKLSVKDASGYDAEIDYCAEGTDQITALVFI